MHLNKVGSVKKILLLLLLQALLVACDDSSSVPSQSTPPLILAVTSPYRIVEYDADTLLVSDASSNAVHFIDKVTLEPTRSLKLSGRPSGIEQFGGLIFVGNLTTGSVDVLNADGELQFYLGGSKGLFQQVNDIAIDRSASRAYVLDTGAARIRVYNAGDGSDTGLVLTGPPVVSAGDPGPFKRPTAVEVDQADGRIFVSDYGPEPAIRVLNSDGTAAAADPILGADVGFSMPQGLFIDSGQNLFLVEARTGEIRVMDSSYNFIKALGTPADPSVRELYYPLDLFVDAASQDVFVTDNQNRRIVVYQGGGTVP